tara:strand:- start:21 stop:647 length:627 start_codon:yes stop_codon:yes gene_type:complete
MSTDFISGWYIDTAVCDGLISFFEDSPYQKPGELLMGVNESRKKSIDVAVSPTNPDERIQNYLDELGKVCDNYIAKFPWCSNDHSFWSLNTNFSIQKYNPNDGFYAWHMERSSSSGIDISRHLVFMTYLNDVTDCGETEWFHQKVKIQPRKGLTVIWPPDWTHTHRGIPSPSQTKYIATGWYCFKTKEMNYGSNGTTKSEELLQLQGS